VSTRALMADGWSLVLSLEWGWLLGTGLWFLIVLGMAGVARQRGWSSEATRKLVHVVGGCATLFFPWVFQSLIGPALLCLAFTVILVGSHMAGILDAVHAIDRRSHGAALFPISVMATLAYGTWIDSPVMATAALGVLVFADAAAALVGKLFGRHQYPVHGGRKTLEGSFAFFVVATAVMGVTLQVGSYGAPLSVWFAALHAAVLLTITEMMASHGWDNFLLPLLAVFVLKESEALNSWFFWLILLVICLVWPLVWLRGSRISLPGQMLVGVLVYASIWLLNWILVIPIFSMVLASKFSYVLHSDAEPLPLRALHWVSLPLAAGAVLTNQANEAFHSMQASMYLSTVAMVAVMVVRHEWLARAVVPSRRGACVSAAGICLLLMPLLAVYGVSMESLLFHWLPRSLVMCLLAWEWDHQGSDFWGTASRSPLLVGPMRLGSIAILISTLNWWLMAGFPAI